MKHSLRVYANPCQYFCWDAFITFTRVFSSEQKRVMAPGAHLRELPNEALLGDEFSNLASAL